MLTRRELLLQLGSGIGAAGIATISAASAGCGSAGTASSRDPRRAAATLRGRLVELVDELERRYPIATALATHRRRTIVGHDASDVAADQRVDALILIQVFDGASWHVRSTNDASARAATLLAKPLIDQRPPQASAKRLTANARPVDLRIRGEARLSDVPPLKWMALVGDLYKRTAEVATSRTIYRGASAVIDIEDTTFVGAGKNIRQRINRVRAGAVFIARSGDGVIAEEALAAGTGGSDIISIGDDELRRASEGSLALIGGDIDDLTDVDVVLDASVVATITASLADGLLDARTWVDRSSALTGLLGDQVADHKFSLVDDASLLGGYGSYDVDDEGAATRARPLIREGVLISPYNDRLSAAALNAARTGNARLCADGVTRASFSNLLVAPGETAAGALIGDVKKGYLVESATMIASDPRRRQVLLRAQRAREILGGSLSGRLVGPLMLRADLIGLLLAIRAVSVETRRFVAAGALARSIEAPTLLTRAELGR